MATLTCSAELTLAHPQMDATYEEFVGLLAAAESALAEHMASQGFDAETGMCRETGREPALAGAEALTGCGGGNGGGSNGGGG